MDLENKPKLTIFAIIPNPLRPRFKVKKNNNKIRLKKLIQGKI